MSHWLLLRHAPETTAVLNQDGRAETGGAVKFNLFTVTVANALCIPPRGCTLAWNFEFWLTCNRASHVYDRTVNSCVNSCRNMLAGLLFICVIYVT